jgi:hypothetical protein
MVGVNLFNLVKIKGNPKGSCVAKVSAQGRHKNFELCGVFAMWLLVFYRYLFLMISIIMLHD